MGNALMKKNQVTFLVPNYNGKELLKKHLFDVFSAADRDDEIIIVDDHSTDQSISWMQKQLKLQLIKTDEINNFYQGNFSSGSKSVSCQVLSLNQNKRFAFAVNQGFKVAKNRHVFLLNNDVSPEKSSREILLQTFDEQENVFAVGCLEYEGEDKSAHRSGKNQLWFEKGLFQHARANNFAFGVTAWASGGSAMFDREKWLELGGFDLEFQPAYWEDIDISFRAKKKGWKVLFQPDAVVFHQHESTNSRVFTSDEIERMSYKHADRFTQKHADFWQLLAFFLWRPYWLIKRRRISGK